MAYFVLFLPLIFNKLEKFPLVLHPAIKKMNLLYWEEKLRDKQ